MLVFVRPVADCRCAKESILENWAQNTVGYAELQGGDIVLPQRPTEADHGACH